MWNQSYVKERDRQRKKDVRGQVISRLFFFQYSRKSNSNIFALMVLLATTVVMHSTSHTLSMTHTHIQKEIRTEAS